MRGNRGFNAVVRAQRKAAEDRALERLGMSDPMWEALEDLHLSRLNKERGRRRKATDRTMLALYKRGLATYVIPAPSPCPYCDGSSCGDDVAVWSCTEKGKALAMAGRDAA